METGGEKQSKDFFLVTLWVDLEGAVVTRERELADCNVLF